jgi:hypothetical protein
LFLMSFFMLWSNCVTSVVSPYNIYG